ncbi:hypothetical protein PF005_g27709 [Phytophthora fragariae]|uniref:SMP domain-containing protein n=1 Tax=Phytophthora fragariae TaxID=53985 RepID=A0A6A3VML8_9STRA|nr:hypothetical protein PF005_g27709 [Phytophthora fragariae]KAE9178235.1 hypothetical protein PF002_g28125 [Phytophthora fragariae]
MDGDTARMVDTSTVPATAVVDKGEVADSTKAVPKDGSVTAVRKAVAAQLNDELAARESERAERYVSTGRPSWRRRGEALGGGDEVMTEAEVSVMTEAEVSVMTAAAKSTTTAQEAVPADPD